MGKGRSTGLVCLGLALVLGGARAEDRGLPEARPVGKLETVATFRGPMLTGVTVSHSGRVFVNFPRWGDAVEFTVAEVKDGKAVAYHPRALWPDTLSLAKDGYLYFTANQLHRQDRFHEGKDLREKPYALFRVKVGATPVLLRPTK